MKKILTYWANLLSTLKYGRKYKYLNYGRSYKLLLYKELLDMV